MKPDPFTSDAIVRDSLEQAQRYDFMLTILLIG